MNEISRKPAHTVAKNAQLPTTATHHLRVARLGLAMGNLEPCWDFKPSTLALALTPGHFALRICAGSTSRIPQKRLGRWAKSSNAWKRRRRRRLISPDLIAGF